MAQATARNITTLPPRRTPDEALARAFGAMEERLNELVATAELAELAAQSDNLELANFSIRMLGKTIAEFKERWHTAHHTGRWPE
jgi:hypothetical protein